jgi:opacity protein-like surface antigen
VAVLALAAMPAVQAQPTSAYYGLALGELDYSEENDFGDEVIADTADSYRLMVGYQFNENLAFEGGWGQVDDIADSALANLGFPIGLVPVHVRYEIEILTVRFVGVLPFDNGITLLGGLGYADMKVDVTIDYEGVGQVTGDGDEGNLTYFAGVQYDWERVALRLGYEKYDMSGGVEIDEASLAFFYKL